MKKLILWMMICLCCLGWQPASAELGRRLATTVPDLNDCPPNQANFCDCFQKEVLASCLKSGANYKLCSHTKLVYMGMIMRYHSLARACKGHNNSLLDNFYCEQDWSCYMTGHNYKNKLSCGHICT